ncbi:hypothetical protein BGAL_0303g00120 [Botrytis galanthina]|uniref:DEAD/DEAH box helicase domain-containing protein n=1 Tax=Botrytis galanthina TaxID=278940 RepID=A0A4S8R0N6_9HELO|nr:hypothetical protein BGAL_0303g00120 [Botrytis galanthina]
MDPGKEPGDAARKGSTVKDAASKLGKQSHLRFKLPRPEIPKQHANRDWSGLPLHGTLVEALRLSKDIEPPTPIRVAAMNSFLSTQKNMFLQAPFDKKSHVLNSGVLSPTVLVILPSNALATQAKAAFDGLLSILNGRINKTWPSEVGPGDVILEFRGAYGEIPWIEQQNARVSEYPHILVATPGRLLHMVRVKMVAFDDLGWYGVKNIMVFLDTREETECLFSA